MSNTTRVHCKRCKSHKDTVGPLSWRGYCGVCGPQIADAATDQQHHHSGEYFERWRRGMAACVGGVLLDDARESA